MHQGSDDRHWRKNDRCRANLAANEQCTALPIAVIRLQLDELADSDARPQQHQDSGRGPLRGKRCALREPAEQAASASLSRAGEVLARLSACRRCVEGSTGLHDFWRPELSYG